MKRAVAALFYKSDVQCAHFVASSAISDLQYGQVFVVGAVGSSFFLNLFMVLTIMNNTNAVSMNEITALIKLPIISPYGTEAQQTLSPL